MNKPHLTLRTHDDPPAPPPWAQHFRAFVVGAEDEQPLTLTIDKVEGFFWNRRNGIRAVEWLP
ncbi:hypothetical protein [Candidatus Dactylopiibacterium carminicum]|nr:hypothetical protein [Candidatus Dactylopiibacterium carminicum]